MRLLPCLALPLLLAHASLGDDVCDSLTVDMDAAAMDTLELKDDAGDVAATLAASETTPGAVYTETLETDGVLTAAVTWEVLPTADLENGPYSLRCSDTSGRVVKMEATGALCTCADGLWMNAMLARLPCYMSDEVHDDLSMGQLADRMTAWPAVRDSGVVPTWTNAPGQCVSNTALYVQYGDTCFYRVYTPVADFATARWECLAAGGWMVAPNIAADADETAALNGEAGNFAGQTNQFIWVGLRSTTFGINTHIPINGYNSGSYIGYDSSEPNSDYENCVSFRTANSRLHDSSCDQNYGYMCALPGVPQAPE